MFDFVVEALSDKWWTYALLAGVIVFDTVLPILPSETALISVGIIAAQGGLSVVGLIAAGWAGAVAGDNLVYTIGDRPGRRLRRRLLRHGLDQAKWVRHQIEQRPWIVGVARFIPGGRTAAALSAGALDTARGRFLAYVTAGGLLWSALGVLLGYAGGSVFTDNFWLPLLVSLLLAAALSAAAEVARRRGLLGPSPEDLDDEDFDDSDLEEEAADGSSAPGHAATRQA